MAPNESGSDPRAEQLWKHLRREFGGPDGSEPKQATPDWEQATLQIALASLKLSGVDQGQFLELVRAEWPTVADGLEELKKNLDESWVDPFEDGIPSFEPPPPPESLEPSNRFLIEGVLPEAEGKKGPGLLYLATDAATRRRVVIKLPAVGQGAAGQRFRREIEITSRLEHPGVPPVYGSGTHSDNRPFYAMRQIGGKTLTKVIRDFHEGPAGRDPTRFRRGLVDLITRFATVCETVAFAHEQAKVLHRDLKPDNIRFGDYGETIVLDWGMAKVLGEPDPDANIPPPTTNHDHPLVTRKGDGMGTHGYASPEQRLGGQAALVDATSDVYGLGATLYQVLTGERPKEIEFKATDEVTVANEAAIALNPALDQDPAIPMPLRAICRKAMRPRPCDRYQTARELAKDLRNWVADGKVSAWREPVRERLARIIRRHPVMTVATGGVLIIAVIAVASVLLVQASQKSERAERRLGIERAVRLDLTRGVQALESGDRSTALPWLSRAYLASRSAELPIEVQRLRLGALEGLPGRLVPVHAWQGQASPTFTRLDPTGRFVLFGQMDGVLRLVEIATGAEASPPLRARQNVWTADFSPDGKRFVTAAYDGVLEFWDRSAWAVPTPPDASAVKPSRSIKVQAGVRKVVFSPDGAEVATVNEGGLVTLWKAGDGTRVREPIAFADSVDELAFAGTEGDRLLASLSGGGIEVRNRGGKLIGRVATPKYRHQFALLPDRLKFAAIDEGRRVQLYSTDDASTHGNPLPALYSTDDASTPGNSLPADLPGRDPQKLAFSPDGRWLAVGYDQFGTQGCPVRVFEAGGSNSPLFKSDLRVSASPQRLRFNAAGDRLLVTISSSARGEEVVVIDLAAEEPRAIGQPIGFGSQLVAADFAGDGHRLVIAANQADTMAMGVGKDLTIHRPQAGAARYGPLGDGRIDLAVLSADGTVAMAVQRGEGGGSDPLSNPRRLVAWSTLRGTEIGPPIELAGTESVWIKALSHDGGRLALALKPPKTHGDNQPSEPSIIRLFDLRGGRPTADVEIGRLMPSTLTFSPDATRLAVAAGLPLIPPGSKLAPRDELRVFDSKTGRAVGPPLAVDFRVQQIDYSADARRLLVVGSSQRSFLFPIAEESGIATVFNLATMAAITRINLPRPIVAAAFSPNGEFVGVGLADGTAQAFAVADGKPRGAEQRHEGAVLAVAFDPSSTRLASGGEDGVALVGSVESDLARATEISCGSRVSSLKFLDTGSLRTSETLQTPARIRFQTWKLPDGQPLGKPEEIAGNLVGISDGPSGDRIAMLHPREDTESTFPGVSVWDEAAGTTVARPLDLGLPVSSIHAVDVDPDGRRIAVAAGQSDLAVLGRLGIGLIRVFDIKSGTPLSMPLIGHLPFYEVSWSRDGQRLLTMAEGEQGNDERQARVYNATTGQPEGPVIVLPNDTHAAFSPDGLLLAISNGSILDTDPSPRLRLLETLTGKELANLSVPGREPNYHVSFSPDGQRIVADFGSELRVWDVASRSEVWVARSGLQIRFDRSGQLLIVPGVGELWIIDSASGKTVGQPIPVSAGLSGAVVGRDGRRMALLADDHSVQVWAIRPQAPVGVELPHPKKVELADFSDDGSLLLTATEDGVLRVWDVSTSSLLLPPLPYHGGISAARFLPGQTSLLVARTDGPAEILDLRPEIDDGAGLELRLRLAAGRELDSSGGIRPIAALDRLRDLRKLTKLGRGFVESEDAEWLWHRNKALVAEAEVGAGWLTRNEQRRANALWHLDRWIAAAPAAEGEAEESRAVVLLAERSLAEAAATARRALAGEPANWVVGLALGRALLQLGQNDEADRVFDAVEKASGKDWWVAFERGRALREAKRFAEAESAFSRAHAAEPKAAQPLRYRAEVRESLGRKSEAAADRTAMAELAPNSTATWYNLGIDAERNGRLAEARDHYSKALKLAPRYDEALTALCRVLAALGEWKALVEQAEALTKEVPDKAPGYLWLGEALIRSGRANLARKPLDRVLELEPANPRPKFLLGQAADARFDRAEAIKSYTEATVINPRYWDAYAARGVAEYRAGNWNAALADLDRASANLPERGDVLAWHAAMLLLAGRTQQAFSRAEEAIKLSPDGLEALTARAAVAASRSDGALADQLFEKVLERDPKFTLALYLRGSWRERTRRYEKALDDYSAAIEADRKDTTTPWRIAQTLLAMGEIDQVVEFAHQARRREIGSIGLDITLGDAYSAQGKFDLAETAYRRAAEANPGLPQNWLNVARAAEQGGRPVEVDAAIDRALKAEPGNREALERRISVRIDRSDWKGALTELDRLASDGQPSVRLLTQRAYVLGRLGLWDRAGDDLEAIAVARPNDLANMLFQVLARAAEGNTTKREAALERLRGKIDAQGWTDSEKCTAITFLTAVPGGVEPAEPLLKWLEKVKPEDLSPASRMVRRGRILFRDDEFEAAVQALREADGVRPLAPSDRFILALALRSNGQGELARSAYDEAIRAANQPERPRPDRDPITDWWAGQELVLIRREAARVFDGDPARPN